MALFKSRIRSALYIDFENIPLNPERISNVVAWLEDGLFADPVVPRRLVERRVYWNSQSNRHRKVLEALGFEVVLIEKYGGLKNGADIRIAMDMVEAALKRRPLIEEFILISKDSDFVPVIQRLGEKDKRTIMLVEEQQPAAYTAYDLHADGIITHRALLQAAQTYQRETKRGLMEKLGLKRKRAPKVKQAAAVTTSATVAAGAAPKAPTLVKPEAPVVPDAAQRKQQIDQAVDAFVKMASRTPGKLTGKQTIMKQLKTIKGFSNTGAKPYFGFKSYEALAKEVSTRDTRITLQEDRLGGVTVVYAPDDAAAESATVSKAAEPMSEPTS